MALLLFRKEQFPHCQRDKCPYLRSHDTTEQFHSVITRDASSLMEIENKV